MPIYIWYFCLLWQLEGNLPPISYEISLLIFLTHTKTVWIFFGKIAAAKYLEYNHYSDERHYFSSIKYLPQSRGWEARRTQNHKSRCCICDKKRISEIIDSIHLLRGDFLKIKCYIYLTLSNLWTSWAPIRSI